MADDAIILTRAAGEGDRPDAVRTVEGAQGGVPDVWDPATRPLRQPAAPSATSPAARVRREDVDVVTFGCRLNAYESDQLAAQATADGIENAVVFNTCAVTAEAVRQARQAIRKARRERPGARLIVTGCAAQIDPASFAAMPEVDLVVGNREKAAAGALADGPGRVRVSNVFASSVGATPHPPPAATPSPAKGEGLRARAYVEVQNGCDHRCTFCIIPFGRGNSRSRPAEAVIAETRSLVRAGFNEVVLTGVDLTSWGADVPGAPSLGALVGAILADVPELRRLRLSSIDAAEIDAELMRRLASEPRLMPHLHLSLQSGDDLILKRMKRRHSRADALTLIEAVRRVRPDTAFGADFIAGFPTETEAAFERTLSFVEEAGLSYLHVFPFSPRPGTPAARMPQLPRAAVKDRAARLRAAGETAMERHLERQFGRVVTALVEQPGRARAEDFTELALSGEARTGALLCGRIFGRDGARALLTDWAPAPAFL
jgi:threonylcarbamoyladenosine tRNA methylthiotransferase MtaB